MTSIITEITPALPDRHFHSQISGHKFRRLQWNSAALQWEECVICNFKVYIAFHDIVVELINNKIIIRISNRHM
jgi:hypothetical protein